MEQAARCAFRIGYGLAFRGQVAHASGWLARARRVLDDAAADSVVRGYLLLPDAFRAAMAGEFARAHELFTQAEAIGQRFGDGDLIAFGRQGQGRTLIKMGRLAEGVALLDEVMVAVTAGELMPTSVGDIYCSVIDACSEIFDLRRAVEWTAALERWCEAQADHMPYRGICRSIAPRFCSCRGRGRMRWAKRSVRATGSWLRRRGRPRGARAISAASCIVCVASSTRPRRRIARRPRWAKAAARARAAAARARGYRSCARSIRQAMDRASSPVVRSRMLGAFV